MLPLHFTSLPTSPPSIGKDMAFFKREVIENESHITQKQKKEFEAVLKQAPKIESIDTLSLVTSQALAVFDNAHTTLLKPKMRRLPVRFHWLSDGLIIVKSTPEYAFLLGQRVVNLGGKTPQSMLSVIPLVVGGGTQSWQRYRSEYFYSAPSALALFGADVVDYSVSLQVESPDGEITTHTLKASDSVMPGDPFWDFKDSFPDDASFNTQGWNTLLRNDDTLPLYLKDTAQLHAIHRIPNSHALYIRMNASFDDTKLSIHNLTLRAKNEIKEGAIKNIIVDFRYNRGGDYTEILPFVKAISALARDNRQLYLIVGTNTFSAGIIASTQFKRYARDKLIVVGSEMGDALRFKAEGYYPTLPYSGVTLYLTKGWTDLENGCGWFDDCWPPNKFLLDAVGTFDIDIPVENDWNAYLTRHDLVLEAIESDIRAKE
ncbi:hypothetical protein D210916BOD24_20860 [Alteromonas sp. D210916BOD_24]|uniref:hypothetical protein n=1 Tax=Alteromonas sp. D210916BOD_24 TaxID=3157618 RepID=UPI00399CB681